MGTHHGHTHVVPNPLLTDIPDLATFAKEIYLLYVGIGPFLSRRLFHSFDEAYRRRTDSTRSCPKQITPQDILVQFTSHFSRVLYFACVVDKCPETAEGRGLQILDGSVRFPRITVYKRQGEVKQRHLASKQSGLLIPNRAHFCLRILVARNSLQIREL